MVTGGAGSVGLEVARQAAALGARRLVLLDHADTALALARDELSRRFPALGVEAVLADVTSEPAVRAVFQRERPEVVVHAAAQKVLSLGERHPAPVVATNVGGTRVVVEAARDSDVMAFVLISSDKAAVPASVVGASRRLAEQVVAEVGAEVGAERQGRFVSLRLPHVVGTPGGVVELFQRQIAMGGPVTITDSSMERTFVTLTDAARLVLLAGAIGEPGAVHVATSGQRMRILDLARDMIRLAHGSTADTEIEEIGLREGERLADTMFGDGETSEPTEVDALRVARDGVRHRGALRRARALEAAARAADDVTMRRELGRG
jgi:FlaA1/EpsC-like NDP-sugar epimerase